MNLDDHHLFSHLDPENMLAEIIGLPDQLASAWELGRSLPLPSWVNIRQVIIAGMGGSAIGADLLAAWLAPICNLPVFINRDYGLPAWAKGPETLLIVSSHSGNTEETLDAFETSLRNNCRLLAVTTGGILKERAVETGSPLWVFDHSNQPRAAVGYSFGLLLAAVSRLGLVPDPSLEISSAVAEMNSQLLALAPHVPASLNPAKLLAGQLVGRWVTVIGSGVLAPVARRWKDQINELAKACANFDTLPEADHNTLSGLINPHTTLSQTATIFLRSATDHPRNQLRAKLTQQAFMLEGINTNDFTAPGKTRMAELWSALHFGDHLAYYLAMAYGVDPTPIPIIQDFKDHLG